MRWIVRLGDGDGRVRAGVAEGARVDVVEGDDPLALLTGVETTTPAATIEALDAETSTCPSRGGRSRRSSRPRRGPPA